MTTSTPVGHCDAGRNEWLESRMMRNVSCPVRRGADGKGPGHRNLASRLPYNLIAQLKGGVKALAMPVGDLVSNWAYMVMASLAWSLKAWSALVLPEQGRWSRGSTSRGEAVAAADGVRAHCSAERRSSRCPARSCKVVPDGCCIGCCRGTRGRAVFLRVAPRLRCRRWCDREEPGSGCPGQLR